MRLDRAARRCALQAMYQFDADREVDEEIVRSTLPGSGAHDDAQVARLLVQRHEGERERIVIRVFPRP